MRLPKQQPHREEVVVVANKTTVTAAVLCEVAVLVATVWGVANAPLSTAIRIIAVARQLGQLPYILGGLGLVWASASMLDDHPHYYYYDDHERYHPLRRILRRMSMPLHLWHLLFLVGGMALVAWMSATSLCDPLVRTAWLRARSYEDADHMSHPSLIRNRSAATSATTTMSLRMEPLSVVTRPLHFPTFAFFAGDEDANITTTASRLHVRLSFFNDANTEHCAINDTEAVRLGRRSLTAAACVLLAAMLIGAALCHRYQPPPEAPKPKPTTVMMTFVVKTLGAPLQQQQQHHPSPAPKPTALNAVATLGGQTVLLALGLSGLAVMGALNGDAAEWDWRAFYLLLGASALAGYLVGGLAHLFLQQPLDDTVAVPLERALLTVWLSVPLLAAQAAHALLKPRS